MEYFNSNVLKRSGEFFEEIRPNVFLVNNFIFETNELKILFSTLWSKIPFGKSFEIRRCMKDFHDISGNQGKLSVSEYNQLHEDCLDFLNKNAKRTFSNQKLMIVSHHVPTFKNYPKEFRNSPIGEGFAVELEDWIARTPIDYWIYGHHHRNIKEFKVGNCNLVTNQLGYLEYRITNNFKPEKIIDFEN